MINSLTCVGTTGEYLQVLQDCDCQGFQIVLPAVQLARFLILF